MEAQIRIGDRTLSYQLRRSARRRTLAVAVDPQDGLIVYSPTRMSVAGLQDFLLEKADWILSNTEKLETQRARAPAVVWESGGCLPLRGTLIQLRIEPGMPSGQVVLDGDTLVVGTPPEDGLLPEPARVRGFVVTWLRQQAALDVEARVHAHLPALGAQPRSVHVREQKRRWGSCSAAGALNFNWRLVLAPSRILDYVVVHELCHLRELNHSPRFWDCVGRLLPEYREPRAWLRHNSLLLDI